ncbi:helix-turn-helix transcriptional regulator [Auritidibacter ignavus]|uniref:Helix-turn-helix transcriptional regulator n=1 Tax=Auritidibacter ignavus TaxID=678932 RepID=A0AAJ6ALI5_9MICC|nr:helix-turn-helix transcriptional regulator [Auritidibacter ignavus]WGH92126.1 helix-turn-helix transcriptional regulator [Auritidibacter ignavus]
MSQISSQVAQIVAQAIESAQFSETYMAEQTNIARSTLQRKLAGKSPFTVDDLNDIAKTLNISVIDLLPKSWVNAAA